MTLKSCEINIRQCYKATNHPRLFGLSFMVGLALFGICIKRTLIPPSCDANYEECNSVIPSRHDTCLNKYYEEKLLCLEDGYDEKSTLNLFIISVVLLCPSAISSFLYWFLKDANYNNTRIQELKDEAITERNNKQKEKENLHSALVRLYTQKVFKNLDPEFEPNLQVIQYLKDKEFPPHGLIKTHRKMTEPPCRILHKCFNKLLRILCG